MRLGCEAIMNSANPAHFEHPATSTRNSAQSDRSGPRLAECLTETPHMSKRSWSAFLRYVRTIRYLRPIQIYSRFRRRPSPDNVYRIGQLRSMPTTWTPPITRCPAQAGRNRFRLLNQEREIATWNDTSIPQLWLYNLHYFAYTDAALVDRWIAENPVGGTIGWDPYPTSLRIANWCKWLLSGHAGGQNIYDSIATQAAWLEQSIETHLLGNHLLANAKALMFAGSVLDCPDSERWYGLGLQLYRKELPQQILGDGAHVERSPMYHSIILEDLLDVCNLASAFQRPVPEILHCVPRMLAWLDHMTHPDGEIAFFNDATFGIAPDPATLHAYADRLGFESAALPLGASGYVRLERENVVVIFDAAVLGPDYQPGHGHADTLSFELSYRGRRLLVNSGTSTYEDCPTRAFERGTAAHNTIRVDGVDQSEMWARFRVARRARPFNVATDHRSFVEAAHDGYRRLRPGIMHWRRIELTHDSLNITDRLEGSGYHKAEVFFHLAPGADPNVHLDPQLCGSVGYSSYSTGWNLLVPNRVILGRWEGKCPVQFVTRISLD